MNKFLIAITVMVAIAGIFLFIILGNIDTIVKQGIEKFGPLILKAPIKLDKVDISVLSGSGEINGMEIGNPEGFKTAYAFRIDRLRIDMDIRSVTSDKVHIKSILIDSPQIMFEGQYSDNNILQLQSNANSFTSNKNKDQEKTPAIENEPSTKTTGKEKKVQIDLLKIVNANIGVKMNVFYDNQFTLPFLFAARIYDRVDS